MNDAGRDGCRGRDGEALSTELNWTGVQISSGNIRYWTIVQLPSGKYSATGAWLALAVIGFSLCSAAAMAAGTGEARMVAGLSAGAVDNLVARGGPQRVAHGIHRFPHLAGIEDEQFQVALPRTGDPDAVLSHETALALHCSIAVVGVTIRIRCHQVTWRDSRRWVWTT